MRVPNALFSKALADHGIDMAVLPEICPSCRINLNGRGFPSAEDMVDKLIVDEFSAVFERFAGDGTDEVAAEVFLHALSVLGDDVVEGDLISDESCSDFVCKDIVFDLQFPPFVAEMQQKAEGVLNDLLKLADIWKDELDGTWDSFLRSPSPEVFDFDKLIRNLNDRVSRLRGDLYVYISDFRDLLVAYKHFLIVLNKARSESYYSAYSYFKFLLSKSNRMNKHLKKSLREINGANSTARTGGYINALGGAVMDNVLHPGVNALRRKVCKIAQDGATALVACPNVKVAQELTYRANFDWGVKAASLDFPHRPNGVNALRLRALYNGFNSRRFNCFFVSQMKNSDIMAALKADSLIRYSDAVDEGLWKNILGKNLRGGTVYSIFPNGGGKRNGENRCQKDKQLSLF